MRKEQKPEQAEQSSNQQPIEPRLDAFNPRVPPVYANDTSIIFSDDDVTIMFGYNVDGGPHPSMPAVRIVVSHSGFLRMVHFWQKRATFLRTIYKETPVGINELQPDKEFVLEAFNKMIEGE